MADPNDIKGAFAHLFGDGDELIHPGIAKEDVVEAEPAPEEPLPEDREDGDRPGEKRSSPPRGTSRPRTVSPMAR